MYTEWAVHATESKLSKMIYICVVVGIFRVRSRSSKPHQKELKKQHSFFSIFIYYSLHWLQCPWPDDARALLPHHSNRRHHIPTKTLLQRL